MPTNDDCPVCNGRKIIITRDYADRERDEPCPHCSEREHCASCIALRAENARLREGLKAVRFWADREVVVAIAEPPGATEQDRWLGHQKAHVLNKAHKEVLNILETALKEPGRPQVMKDEQKDLLRQARDEYADQGASGCHFTKDAREKADAIEAALKEVERGRWIPLSERKPEENQYVLLWSPGPWLRLAYWSSFVGSEATHWMLPQEDPQ